MVHFVISSLHLHHIVNSLGGDNLEIIRMQIAYEGFAFYDIGKQVYLSHINNLIKNPQEYFYKILPAIVNLSFSIELFLKSFLKDEDGRKLRHDLEKLLRHWGDLEKTIIINAIVEQMKQYDTDFNEEKFWKYMDRNKFAFEKWRYYYQRGDHVDITFLYVVATVLNNFALRFKESGL